MLERKNLIGKKMPKRIAVVAAGCVGILAMPFGAFAQDMSAPVTTEYKADLQQLNGSGASGNATLSTENGASFNGQPLTVSIAANGLVPSQTHAVHIHGKDNPEVALCPTVAADTNKDGFISVVEGAPSYGLIKMSLTSPQTPFGKPPTLALFTPFAGTPESSNFPKSDANGHFSQTGNYVFDSSPATQGALASLLPLENQEIVVHGGNAPASVDADAFAVLGAPVKGSLTDVSYDALLPVACGGIQKVTSTMSMMTNGGSSQNQARGMDFKAMHQAALSQFEMNKAHDKGAARDQYLATLQSARDQYISQVYESRNMMVDMYNRTGSIQERDMVIRDAQQKVDDSSRTFESSKHAFLEENK
jgi:hypothetical protein